MMPPVILSLFPGADLFGRAFELGGCCVVRGPELLLGQDIETWTHPPGGFFDGVLAGPPCQKHSTAKNIGGFPGRHVDYIPMCFELIPKIARTWGVIENVPAALKVHAPPSSWGVVTLRDWDCGGLTNRKRIFYIWPRGVADAIAVPQRRPGKPAWTVLASSYKTGKKRRDRHMHACLSADEAALLQGWPEIAATMQAESLAGSKGNRLISKSFIVHCLGNGVPRAMGEWLAREILAASRSGRPLLRLA